MSLRAHSGVGTIAREIVFNTGHHFNWVQIAGSVKHKDKGKVLDLSEICNIKLKISDSYLKLYPVDGYGDVNILRQIIDIEKPDALMLITDPRYFEFIFQIENEIRSTMPIIYLNIWDNLPIPYYNKPFYESCDLLLGISKQTHYINDKVLGDDKGDIITKYLPHGLNENEIYPIDKTDKDFVKFKNNLLGDEDVDFIFFFNSRNVRRKQIPDLVMSYRLFLDKLPKEKSKKVKLIMHTDKVSIHGTDLVEVCDVLLGGYPNSYIIHDVHSTRDELNYLYNMADVVMLLSSNEGWGLSLTESLLSGTPFIANVTGGMQDQMRFELNNEWYVPSDEIPSNNIKSITKCGSWAFPVFPNNISIQGSPKTPYVFEDRCEPRDVANIMLRVWMTGKDYLESRGLQGRNWALSDEAGLTSSHQALRFIEYTKELFDKWGPLNKHEIINLTEYKSPIIEKIIY